MVTPIDADAMMAVVRDVLAMPKQKREKEEDDICRSFFGAPIAVIVQVWNLVLPFIDMNGALPKHILWALVFLKTYSTTAVHCRIVGWPDPKTYRKWSWYFVELIASLKDDLIQLDDRFQGYNGSVSCLMSIDGVDCMINEPWPFNEKWYSKKFNGPGVKYEVGVCIATGRIVWLNGPFVASTNDGTIFKNTLEAMLADDEGVEVDAGYKGSPKFKTPTVAVNSKDRKQKSVVRGRHENVNGRLKIFDVLNIPFRHTKTRQGKSMMENHGSCMKAVAVITNCRFDNGDKLYGVQYDVQYY